MATSRVTKLEQWMYDIGALKQGHFALAPKQGIGHVHAPHYFDKRVILNDDRHRAYIASLMARRIVEKLKLRPRFDQHLDAIVGIDSGTLVLGDDVRLELEKKLGYGVEYVQAMKNNPHVPRTDFYLTGRVNLQRCLVAEDVGSSSVGGNAWRVVNAIRAQGGEVLGVVYMFNRGIVTSKKLGAPVTSLVRRKLPMYAADPTIVPALRRCKQCWGGESVNTDIGHGEKWLEEARVAGTTTQ